MDKDVQYNMAVSLLKALVYGGTGLDHELEAALVLLEPDDQDPATVRSAEQTAIKMILGYANNMEHTIADCTLTDDQ